MTNTMMKVAKRYVSGERKKHGLLGAMMVAVLALTTTVASADEGFGIHSADAQVDEGPTQKRGEREAALTKAVELTAATSYAQPLGGFGSGLPSVSRMAGPGFGLEGAAGARINPRWSIGAYGGASFHDANAGFAESRTAYSLDAGLQGGFHLRPLETLDPWLQVGTGWRGLWVTSDRGRNAAHGMDILRAQIGVDYRMTDQVRLSPFVGATLTTFFSRSLAAEGNQFDGVDSPKVSTFLNAGIMGRFDLGGQQTPARVARR